MTTFWEITISSHCILSICNIYLFPVLVLREGFFFCLRQFLFITFLLLLVTKAFQWEKVKTVDFSEIIAASDLKVSRSSHLIEYMKLYEY